MVADLQIFFKLLESPRIVAVHDELNGFHHGQSLVADKALRRFPEIKPLVLVHQVQRTRPRDIRGQRMGVGKIRVVRVDLFGNIKPDQGFDRQRPRHNLFFQGVFDMAQSHQPEILPPLHDEIAQPAQAGVAVSIHAQPHMRVGVAGIQLQRVLQMVVRPQAIDQCTQQMALAIFQQGPVPFRQAQKIIRVGAVRLGKLWVFQKRLRQRLGLAAVIKKILFDFFDAELTGKGQHMGQLAVQARHVKIKA